MNSNTSDLINLLLESRNSYVRAVPRAGVSRQLIIQVGVASWIFQQTPIVSNSTYV